MEFVNIEYIQHEFQEAINFWFQVRVESHATSNTLSAQSNFTNPLSGESHGRCCRSACLSLKEHRLEALRCRDISILRSSGRLHKGFSLILG